MHISITVTKDDSAKIAAMKDAGARLLRPLARAWASGAQEVLGRAIKGRFTGRGPFPVSQNRLGIVTNRLRKAMRATPVQVDASSGTATVSMGSNVKYYRGHEFGFRGKVQVKAHTRRAVAGNSRRDTKVEWGTEIRTSRGKLTKKTAKAMKTAASRGRANYSNVRPHSRRVNVAARRPLGTELAAVTTRLTLYSKIKAVMKRMLGGAQ